MLLTLWKVFLNKRHIRIQFWSMICQPKGLHGSTRGLIMIGHLNEENPDNPIVLEPASEPQ